MTIPIFEPERLVAVLNRHGVRYVIIGGIAAGLQGAAWTTADLDICYARDRVNLKALAEALAELDARPVEWPADAPPPSLDARALGHGDVWTLETRHGRLDLIGMPAPGIDHAFLARTAERFEVDGEPILVAGLEELMAMKRAAGRPQDRAHLELLMAARELAGASGDEE